MGKSHYKPRRYRGKPMPGGVGGLTRAIYYLDLSWTGSPPFEITVYAVIENEAGVTSIPFPAWEIAKTFDKEDFIVWVDGGPIEYNVAWQAEDELIITSDVFQTGVVCLLSIHGGTQSLMSMNDFRCSGLLGRAEF